MRLATTTGDFNKYTKTPAEAVRAFEGTGFRYLDYSFYNVIYPGSPFLTDDWLREVDEAAEAASQLGFTFVQAHSPNYNPLDLNSDHEAGMLVTVRSIEACGRLGIPNIVVHSGFSKTMRYPENREAYFRANRAYYERLFPAMERWNVNVLIENSAEKNMGSRFFFMTGREMADFLDWVGHPLLHACWDIGHANMRGANQHQEICALGNHLRAVHIQDNYGACDEHFAPMMGTVDMDAVMQGLQEVGFPGPFTFEAENLLTAAGSWPHARMQTEGISRRPLASPSLELRRKAERLLYEIGRYILTSYECFEG